MSLFEFIAQRATPIEVAKLLEEMTAETERYQKAFYAAKALIESHVADHDMTEEMSQKHKAYIDASKGL